MPLKTRQKMFNKIKDEYLIFISEENIELKSKCSEEDNLTFQGNFSLKIPTNCTIELEAFKFGSTQTFRFGKTLILPKEETKKNPQQVDYTLSRKFTIFKVKSKPQTR